MIKDYFLKLGADNAALVTRIRTAQGINNNGRHGYDFIVSCLQILYNNTLTEQELIVGITDGSFDDQLDAVIVKDGFVDIYDFKGNKGYGINELRLFSDSIYDIFFGNTNNLNASNSRIQAVIPIAKLAISNGAKIRIRVARYSPDKAGRDAYGVLNTLVNASIQERKIYSGYDLINERLNIESSVINYAWSFRIKTQNLQARESQSIILRKSNDNSIQSLFCRIKLKDLIDLYHHFQPNPEIIFDSNVRALQNDRKIKREMLGSLTGGKALSFHQLHNGITIVCDNIEDTSALNFKIQNPQIVNGCQTITNLAEEYADNRTAQVLTDASILCKISNAKHNEIEAICQASNSQTGIKPWDLRTNDAIQITIESYLQLNNIRYNRKSKTRGQNHLTFVELGQWLFTCFLSNPSGAKNKKRTIFDSRSGTRSTYITVFNYTRSLPDILSIVNDGIFIRGHIQGLRNKTFEKYADLHFLLAFQLLKTKTWTNTTKFNQVKGCLTQTITHLNGLDPDKTIYSMFVKTNEGWLDLEPRIRAL